MLEFKKLTELEEYLCPKEMDIKKIKLSIKYELWEPGDSVIIELPFWIGKKENNIAYSYVSIDYDKEYKDIRVCLLAAGINLSTPPIFWDPKRDGKYFKFKNKSLYNNKLTNIEVDIFNLLLSRDLNKTREGWIVLKK